MSTTKRPYETPTLQRSGDVVKATNQDLVRNIETDGSGAFPMGSVGFGV